MRAGGLRAEGLGNLQHQPISSPTRHGDRQTRKQQHHAEAALSAAKKLHAAHEYDQAQKSTEQPTVRFDLTCPR